MSEEKETITAADVGKVEDILAKPLHAPSEDQAEGQKSTVFDYPHQFSVGQEVIFNDRPAKIIDLQVTDKGVEYAVSYAAVSVATEDQLKGV